MAKVPPQLLDESPTRERALGFVETPPAVVETMCEKLFAMRPPDTTSRILDPGCGNGAFIQGILDWAQRNDIAKPAIVGVELDYARALESSVRFADEPSVEIRNTDFLSMPRERFDFIIGNPPYVPITSISPDARRDYRQNYESAKGRFDLYLLFFEQALNFLAPSGRLVFITPEKFLYVETAAPLRLLLSQLAIRELAFVSEQTFPGLITYPLITTVDSADPSSTAVVTRDARQYFIDLKGCSDSWLRNISEREPDTHGPVLEDICLRISCGVATGADAVFSMYTQEIPAELREFARPTISGREIKSPELPELTQSLLVPYDKYGRLIAEESLGALGKYLRREDNRLHLLRRTCAQRKPWYAYHETPPMSEILKPKVICKDIGEAPVFVVDDTGEIMPRHSTYYVVPRHAEQLSMLAEYLNSRTAREWLEAHCQRAANSFLRVQSHVLKRLPIPIEFLHADAASERDAIPA